MATGICDWLLGCCTTLEQEDFVAAVTSGDDQSDTYALTLELRSDPIICRDLVKGHLLEMWRDADAAVATGRALYNEAATAAQGESAAARAAGSATSAQRPSLPRSDPRRRPRHRGRALHAELRVLGGEHL